MPAGDLLTVPGDVEWDGILLSASGPVVSGYWLTSETDRSGWHPTWRAEDAATEAGAAPGKAIRAAMYPTLIGVAVETSALLNDLIESMDPTAGSGPLAWWDPARGIRFTAAAHPRRAETSTAEGVQYDEHHLIDLMWVIGRPGLIVDLDEGS